MVATRKIQIKEFAERVERLCDFFIGKAVEETGRNGSPDLKILEDLKEDAANIQFSSGTQLTEGLSDYMSGISSVPEEKN